MKKIFVLLLVASLVSVIFFSGCAEKNTEEKIDSSQKAVDACIKKCQESLNSGKNLSNGPCLSNQIIENWVCDVAHSPRIPEIDNKPENQCSEFGKSASHFVEVDPNCNFIKSY